MRFHVLTLFPEMVLQGLNTSILGRAQEKGLIGLHAVDIRDYTLDRHGKVDDYPYGGGAGMLIQAQPVYDAFQSVAAGRRLRTVYVTPQGKPFTQKMAEEFALEEELVLLCGHYEGIDERVLEEIVTDYVSIGDYVLTGGELPAMVMIDAISRLVPGVLNNETSAQTESFSNHLLEYPQYSRPVSWHGKEVPEILLSGDHRKISRWRLERSVERTAAVRPDLYAGYQARQEAILSLSRHKREHIHMMEMLARGRGELLYHKGGDVMLYDRRSGTCLITAETEQGGRSMIKMLADPSASDLKNLQWFVVCQEFLVLVLKEAFDLHTSYQCCQACYTRKEPLAVRHKDIRNLDESGKAFFLEHYPYGDESYFKDRMASGFLYGAYVEGKLTGFIGLHDDGSMGMLYVDEACRGRGIGSSLEAYLINRLRELDWTPYCHIFSDNRESRLLQEKLGLYLSKDTIWWLGREAGMESGLSLSRQT